MAKITIDPNKPIGAISPHIYGHFTEHIGGVIYDGIWVGKDSSIPNVKGIRLSLIEHLKRINPSVIRWPGGCFADRYHWQDGIGSREKRPRRYGRWSDVTEPNYFGTHEFIDFCRLVDAEPYFAGNVGTGSAEEFQQWIEYCNAPSNTTTLADVRAENGSPDPFRVKFWGVGNEAWGCGGSFTPEDYADYYRQFTTWLPAYNMPLYCIACGPNGDDRDWTKRFFEQYKRASGTIINGWSFHYYCGSAGGAIDFTEAQFYELLNKANVMEKIINSQWELLEDYDPQHNVKLIVDEWGAWHPSGTEINSRHLFEQISTMRDALIAGLTLDTFNRHADKVYMANVAQMINNLHSLFLADEEKFVATPNYYVYEMYLAHQGALSLHTEFDTTNVGDLPILAGSSSIKDKVICLTITNLHATESMETEICINEAVVKEARITCLSHDDIHAHNTFTKPMEVVPKMSKIELENGRLIHNFNPASVTKLDIIVT
jgi:alpha-N-arabinofuranosidase